MLERNCDDYMRFNTGMPPDGSALTALTKYGLLLLNDPALPNLCRLVAGERAQAATFVW